LISRKEEETSRKEDPKPEAPSTILSIKEMAAPQA